MQNAHCSSIRQAINYSLLNFPQEPKTETIGRLLILTLLVVSILVDWYL